MAGFGKTLRGHSVLSLTQTQCGKLPCKLSSNSLSFLLKIRDCSSCWQGGEVQTIFPTSTEVKKNENKINYDI